MKPPITVIGCGVSGLSCGIRLLEQGFDVTLIARELPPHTTSNVAAAIWYPYKAYPIERVLRWGQLSFDEFARLMAEPEAGVSWTTLYELFDRPAPDPWWQAAVRQFRRAQPAELPPGYVDGYVVDVPLIETPLYMAYLVNRLQHLGGQIRQQTVASLAGLTPDASLIVNCAGLGAREVAGDESLYPIRGQIIRVKTAQKGRAFMDQAGPRAVLYTLFRRDDCILGGTTEENNWRLTPDPATAGDIWRKCGEIEPALENAEILEHLIGLRPGRPAVRLELEPVSKNCAIIHNYGHGGAGFTLSWGCAAEVARLAMDYLAR